jgi:guanosine-diphosphatase
MMDAGSTGSRTHVFQFNVAEGGKKMELVHEVFEELKPGLSSFRDDPEAAAQSLVPLMDAAMKSVPREYARCTPLALKATAGLRLIGEEKSEAILAAVRDLFKKYPFATTEGAAVVMDGKEEGPYAWLTVNFLLGTLERGHKTAAILDMGGGSTQIVFEPDSEETLKEAPPDHVFKVTLQSNRTFTTYQHSYLGLGLKEANNALLRHAAKEAADFACLPKGHTMTIDDAHVANSGDSDFDKCVDVVKKAVVRKNAEDDAACPKKPCAFNNVYQPSLSAAFSGPVYAFSYFYDRMEPFLPSDGRVTVGQYKSIGRKICEGKEEPYADKNVGTMCMDYSFLYTLLSEGYGLNDDRELWVKKKINGIETAWPLGAALSQMG